MDVDRPSEWKKFPGQNFCTLCKALCCTMPVEVDIEDLQIMGLVSDDEVATGSNKKIAKKLLKDKKIVSYRAGTGLFMLSQKTNRDCMYLDSRTRLCSLYERRPKVCRKFPEIGPRVNYCPYQKK